MLDTDKETGQNDLPMTGSDLRRIRLHLGLTQADFEEALRIDVSSSPGRTVRRWEAQQEKPVPGPVSLAVEVVAARHRRALLSGDNKMKVDVINLDDGEAQAMGDGVFVLFQEEDGVVQTVVLTPGDLSKLLAANAKGTRAA